MPRAKIEPPLAGVLVRRVGVASSATGHAAGLSTVAIDKSTLGANANAYIAAYPSEVVLYRTAGFLPKPVPEVIRARPRTSICTIDWRVEMLAGLLTITFDDDTHWTVEFARGEHKHVRGVIDVLSSSPAPPIAS
jgi:hypothetical protein